MARYYPQTETDAVAIQSLTIGGNVTGSQILAGYNLAGAATNADASIGKVLVRGNWSASDLVAGIADITADDFGRNDTLIPGGSDSIVATIASLTIRGTATGSTIPDDFFGITAESIRKAKIGGMALGLTLNKDDLLLDRANADFRLVEL
jgi:hypothetical protein